jgi:uncharacterized protein (DUF1499 family)
MTDLTSMSPWTRRFSTTALSGGVGAAILALIGSYGSGFGFWNFEIGFLFLAVALMLAMAGLITGITALLKGGAGGRTWLGLLCSVAFLGIMGYVINLGVSNPPLHDISTDLTNPPAFQKLELRKDNLIGVDTIENWRAVHAKALPDIEPMTPSIAPADAIKKVEEVVRARGWDVALVTADRIEATETVSPFKFKDDVVITVAPGRDGKGSVVNIRSVSRVGLSDLGFNAARVRALVADLAVAFT